jgi:hypothetical protein
MFYKEWSESGIEGMMSDFRICEKDLEGVTIIHAYYNDDGENYCGDAYVLFAKGDKYYEVHGSHCSCMGLEDQWEPEECTYEELTAMLKRRDTDTDLIEDLRAYIGE